MRQTNLIATNQRNQGFNDKRPSAEIIAKNTTLYRSQNGIMEVNQNLKSMAATQVQASNNTALPDSQMKLHLSNMMDQESIMQGNNMSTVLVTSDLVDNNNLIASSNLNMSQAISKNSNGMPEGNTQNNSFNGIPGGAQFLKGSTNTGVKRQDYSAAQKINQKIKSQRNKQIAEVKKNVG